MRALDAMEERLAAAARVLARPGPLHAAAALLVLLAILVRLPLVVVADDACCGHGDSWVFFHQAYADYASGNVYPDAHRGAGWSLLLYGTLQAFGFEPGAWAPYFTPLEGEAARAALVAHTLSAMLAAGAVAATFLLARELMPPAPSLLAAALVAFDPYLLGITTSAMSEPLYVPLFALATWSVLKARAHPAWLLLTGALMALASMLRINGVVMFGMLGLFALVLLRARPLAFLRTMWRAGPDRRLLLWGFAALAVFLAVSAPYLAWRAAHYGSPFDYGTNQRFWADDLWDFEDPYWTTGERETMRDYFAEHSLADAAQRLWESWTWQVFDLVGVGKWPQLEEENGRWVGTRPDGPALTPLLVVLGSVGALLVVPKRRELWFLPLALLVTFATFTWIYPLVRSVRYFSPLIPLVAVVAVLGWMELSARLARPRVVAAVLFGGYVALYTAKLWLAAPEALVATLATREMLVLAAAGALLWCGVAVAPLVRSIAPRVTSGPWKRGVRSQR